MSGEPAPRLLLRIYLDTFQKWHHRPVYEVLVERAKEQGLAGATVLAAVEGFGQTGALHADRPWRLASDREVVVEFVDEPGKVEAFLAGVEPLLADAVVTRKATRTALLRPGREEKP